MPEKRRVPGRIGPWRLLDIFAASLELRGAFLGAGAILPRTGPADTPVRVGDPAGELPDSYVSDFEQQQAMAQERSRRYVRARRRERGEAADR
ncbi:MAG TPA: hypothetical protein VFY79_03940 [Dehalococcoidia bacterium]|jgi:hypothetical protein|nr:hypothetical protein [Dehalococcoidia bacterium]